MAALKALERKVVEELRRLGAANEYRLARPCGCDPEQVREAVVRLAERGYVAVEYHGLRREPLYWLVTREARVRRRAKNRKKV